MMKNSSNDLRNQTLIFLHIAKTGGNSFQRLIERKYRPEQLYRFIGGLHEDFEKSREILNGLSKEDNQNIRCVWGGPYFGIHKDFHEPFVYVAFLRNPVDRVISEYYWILRRRTNKAHEDVTARKMSLEEFVKEGVWRAWNGQTRFIRRIPEASPPGSGPVSLSDNDLNIAKSNLSQNCVIGLTEHFDESLILIKRALGWHLTDIFYTRQNVAKKRPKVDDIDENTLGLIRDTNKLDLELYDYAVRAFEERIAQLGPSFERELRTFRLLNRVFGPVMGIYTKVRLIIYGPLRSFLRLLRSLFTGKVSVSFVLSQIQSYFKYLMKDA